MTDLLRETLTNAGRVLASEGQGDYVAGHISVRLPNAPERFLMKPAGIENSQGLITALYLKDPTDKQWESSKDFQDWKSFMTKYIPNGDLSNGNHVFGYAVANLMVTTLKQAGDDLTRANVMRQAASLKNINLPLLLPGIKVNTAPDDYRLIKTVDTSEKGMPTQAGGINGGLLKRPEGYPGNAWVNYVNVESLDASVEKAQTLGAKVTKGKAPVPGMGWFAMLIDPQGNHFALWQSDSNAK